MCISEICSFYPTRLTFLIPSCSLQDLGLLFRLPCFWFFNLLPAQVRNNILAPIQLNRNFWGVWGLFFLFPSSLLFRQQLLILNLFHLLFVTRMSVLHVDFLFSSRCMEIGGHCNPVLQAVSLAPVADQCFPVCCSCSVVGTSQAGGQFVLHKTEKVLCCKES